MTRRGLLASAALLAGCGAADEDAPPPGPAAEAEGGTSTLADVSLLNDALALERRAGHADRAALLERLIRRREGDVQPLDPGPGPEDPLATEEELVALYVDQLPKLSEPLLRTEVAALLRAAATGAAEVRLERGEDPAPAAFVTGVRPEDLRP